MKTGEGSVFYIVIPASEASAQRRVMGHLNSFDGVMIGREAFQSPYSLADIERTIFGNENVLSRIDVVRAMIPYNGLRGARHLRRILSTEAVKDGATAQVVEEALP